MCYSPRGQKESDMTEDTHTLFEPMYREASEPSSLYGHLFPGFNVMTTFAIVASIEMSSQHLSITI